MRVKKHLLRLMSIPETIINLINIHRKGVHHGNNFIINGIASFHGEYGTIQIGNNVIINSKHSANPSGGFSKTLLSANHGGHIFIDDHAGISLSAITAHEYIYIGKYSMLGVGVRIYDTDFHSLSWKDRLQVPDRDIKTAPVYIGNHVFIGAGAIILKGISIGDYSVIGAGSVVTKNIPENEVWAGNPARFVKKAGINGVKSSISISVIIPNYNKSEYLARCIESVISQTWKPDEIIIIDDCSTDTSVQLIKQFSENFYYIRPIFLKQNKGVSHARNIGAQAANSTFITFLDSDDYYYNKNKLKNEIELILSQDNNIVSYSLIKYVDEKESDLPSPKEKIINGNAFLQWMKGKGNIAIARDYCLKKEMFEQVGMYDEGCAFYEDLDLLLRLSEKFEFYCTNQYGTAYRQVPGGLSSNSQEKHKSARIQIRKKYIHKLRKSQKVYILFYWSFKEAYHRIKQLIKGGL